MKTECDIRANGQVEKELDRLFPGRVIKRVLLVAPPDVDKNLFNYKTAKMGRYWNYAPYGLGIIASHLRNDGLSVKIINLNSEVLKSCRLSISEEDFDFERAWKNVLVKEMQDFKPDIAGITCMFTQTHKSAVEVCNEIKLIKPDLPIAIGGVHVTTCFMDEETSNLLLNDFKNTDMFFLYEAELAFRQFVKVVNGKDSPDMLCQVYFNSSPEKFYFSKKKIPTEKELGIIPAHDLMTPEDLVNYGVIGSFFCYKEKGTKITTVLSNRGCRGQCTYCSVKNFNGRGIRHRSVQSIIDELLILRNRYGIGHVMWLDDDLLHDHKRTLRLFKEMVRNKIGITWDCTNGVIALSCIDEIIAAAQESGCIGLTVGVESGNPEILKKMKKPGSVDIFIKAAKVLRKYEQIVTRVFLMIGFPGETYRMILDTFNLAMKMDLDWYNISAFEPLPSTQLFETLVKKGSLSQLKFENIRYNCGPYGKIREKVNKNIFLTNFKNPFENVDLDKVPPRSELDNIWFFMNYHLNFKRLYKENRPIKLEQHLKYVQNITDLVAPEDPFPMYFCGYLQKKVLGSIDNRLIEKLENHLHSSEYWKRRFEDCNLSVGHLKRGIFPGESKI